MSTILNKILAKPSIFLLKYLGDTKTEPTDITLVVATAGAAAGATSVPFDEPGSGAITIPKNAFIEADTDLLVCQADGDLTGGASLTLGTFGSTASKGITTAVADDDTMTWDQLYMIVGKQSHPFSKNANINTVRGVEYHGQGDDVQIDKRQVSSIAPSVAVSGVLDWGSQVHQDLEQYADTNAYWWAKQLFISEDPASILATRENYGKVTNWAEGVSVDGYLSASFVFNFEGDASLTFA